MRKYLKLLLVDSDIDFRAALKTIICNRFPQVQVYEADSDALRLVEDLIPDILIIDIGDDLRRDNSISKKLKRIRRSTFVCALSQYEYPEYRNAAQARFADEFLYKGSDNLSSAIIQSIEGAVGKHTVRRRH